MVYHKDTVLYAGWDQSDAKQYCKRFHLTKEEVRMVDREGQILIIAKKDVVLVGQ